MAHSTTTPHALYSRRAAVPRQDLPAPCDRCDDCGPVAPATEGATTTQQLHACKARGACKFLVDRAAIPTPFRLARHPRPETIRATLVIVQVAHLEVEFRAATSTTTQEARQ